MLGIILHGQYEGSDRFGSRRRDIAYASGKGNLKKKRCRLSLFCEEKKGLADSSSFSFAYV